MKLFRYISFLAISALGFGALTSCDSDEEFLEEHPRTFYTTDAAYGTGNQIRAILTDCYKLVCIRIYDQDPELQRPNDVVDLAVTSVTSDESSNFNVWSPTMSAGPYREFRRIWNMIGIANFGLQGIEEPTMNEELRMQYHGELLFFRGYGYLLLCEGWGGQPIVDKYYEQLKLDFTRASRADTYLFCIKDFEDAIEMLPDHPTEQGRVAKGAALHALTEAYVALGTITEDKTKANEYFDKAIAAADRCVTLHPLMTKRFGVRSQPGKGPTINGIAAYRPDYHVAGKTPKEALDAIPYEDVHTYGDVWFDLFCTDNTDWFDGNTESIWCLQHQYNNPPVAGDYTTAKNSQNWNVAAFMVNLRGRTWAPAYKEGSAAGPWNPAKTADYDLTLCPTGTNQDPRFGGRGTASFYPTTYAAQEIWDYPGGYDMRNNRLNVGREFRCIDKKHSLHGQVITRDMLDPSATNQAGFFPAFFRYGGDDPWFYQVYSTDGKKYRYSIKDRYIFRSSNTILLRAEAKLRKGDKNGAAADINIIRDRAECEVKATPAMMTIQFILDERARELYLEELRLLTLLRMGQDGINSLNAHGMGIAPQTYYSLDGKTPVYPPSFAPITWTLLPYPQSVIDGNTGAIIEQNPGWESAPAQQQQ